MDFGFSESLVCPWGLLALCQSAPLWWSVSVIASVPLNRPIQETFSAVKIALSKGSFSRMKTSHKSESFEGFWWGIWVSLMLLYFKGATNELMKLNWLAFLTKPHKCQTFTHTLSWKLALGQGSEFTFHFYLGWKLRIHFSEVNVWTETCGMCPAIWYENKDKSFLRKNTLLWEDRQCWTLCERNSWIFWQRLSDIKLALWICKSV